MAKTVFSYFLLLTVCATLVQGQIISRAPCKGDGGYLLTGLEVTLDPEIPAIGQDVKITLKGSLSQSITKGAKIYAKVPFVPFAMPYNLCKEAKLYNIRCPIPASDAGTKTEFSMVMQPLSIIPSDTEIPLKLYGEPARGNSKIFCEDVVLKFAPKPK